MIGFDFTSRTRLVFGPNTVDTIGNHATEWSAKRALLVTDPHIAAAGHAPRAQQSLEAAGIHVTVFDQVRENPTTEDVANCLAAAKAANIDTFIAVGGGSTMDTAKGANFILTNGGAMSDYWGVGKASKPMLPLIAVPTTAGTGSECQSFALIADANTHQKMACGDPKAAPRISILDPTLTLTQPPQVTADTGIDALAHAVETAVTKKHNELSLLYAREAFRLVQANLPTVLQQPQNLEARAAMLLGAAYAGTAIENSMLGAAHSAANPLTAHFNVVHGQAVGLMLPAVVRFNAQDPQTAALYAQLAAQSRLVSPDADDQQAVEALIQRIETLLEAANLPRSLTQANVTRQSIPTLAEEAATQWTANFNPRTITAPDFIELYESVYEAPATANAS